MTDVRLAAVVSVADRLIDDRAEEVAALHAQLEDANETLRAIRNGDADALVVDGLLGPRVYTLHTADESYRTIVEQMGQGALILSENGTILYCNSRLNLLLGRTHRSTSGQALVDLVVPAMREELDRLLEDGSRVAAEGEFLLTGGNGEAVPVQISVSPLRTGDFRGRVAIITDLSEQKRRDKAAERERMADAVLEFAGTAILVCDSKGRIVRANPAALVLAGHALVDLHFEQALDVNVQFRELCEGAPARPRHATLRSREGEQRSLLMSARQIGSGGPGDTWWVITLVDHSDREQLLRAERRARLQTQSLQEVTAALSAAATPRRVAEVIVGIGRSALGADAGRVALLSPAEGSLDLLAAEGDLDLLAAEGFSVGGVPPSFKLSVNSPGASGHTLRTGEICTYTSEADRLRRLGGPVLPDVEGGISAPLLVDGRSLGVLGFHYRTEHHWTAEELGLVRALSHHCAQALDRAQLYAGEREARRQAESANRAKVEFLNVMSHELRTPLNSVVGYADLLLLEVNGPLTDGQVSYAERIQSSAMHQLSLIDELLAYARLESGHDALRLSAVQLKRVIRDVVEFVAPEAARKSLVLRAELTEIGEVQLLTDPGKLRQVLLNLAGNATKFTRAGCVEITAELEAACTVAVRIRDTGPGIAASRIDAIWEPFTQLDSTFTRENGGTGLGLAIVRQLVGMLGGSIEVESEVGRGTIFTLRLPTLPETGPRDQLTEAPNLTGSNGAVDPILPLAPTWITP